MMKKVSKKTVGLELGRVYKITSYVFVQTDEINDSDFFVDSDCVFTHLRQTVESKPVTDEF